jgi:hypothetical protein
VVKRWLRAILFVVITTLWNVVPVFAATTQDVTITATPMTTIGILNFTITYVSDTNLQFDWGFAPGTTKIMIRAKYGEYPADIPNINTAPTDGYLVYYGAGITANDTSMDLDENPGFIFYKAWGQNADGTWQVATSTGSKESRGLQLIAIIILAALVSYFSLRSSNILLGLAAALPWLILLVYTRANPIAGLATGSFGDELIVYLCWIFMIVLPLIAIVRKNKEKQYFGDTGGTVEWGESRNLEAGERKQYRSPLDNEAYRARVRRALRRES